MVEKQEENDLMKYYGCNFLKQRLVLSVLSGKPIEIRNIRPPNGLHEFEISLIRLLDRITNGTKVEINSSGTNLLFVPGFLEGGLLQHECNPQKGIGYYLDALIALGPFCKTPLTATLTGVTNSSDSPSIEYIKASYFNLLLRFLVVNDGLELKVTKRGMMPLGGGEVIFKCPVRKELKALQVTQVGMVKRIRGTVYSCKVPATVSNRTVEAAKGVLLKFLPDIYIYTDQNKGKLSGKSPGYGIHLGAETNQGAILSAEGVSNSNLEEGDPTVPEDLGVEVANKLLDEIFRGGCVDSSCQWLTALFMSLSAKDVSKFVTGMLSDYTIEFLRHIKDFFGVTFKIDYHKEDIDEEDEDEKEKSPKVMLTCVGIGYRNTNKRIV